MGTFKNPYKSMIDFADNLSTDNEKLRKENEELNCKLETIDDYYQAEIKKLVERIEVDYKKKIQDLEDEIKNLKSRALANPQKITDKQVNEVKSLRANGMSYRAIAKETKLGSTTVGRILNGEYDS